MYSAPQNADVHPQPGPKCVQLPKTLQPHRPFTCDSSLIDQYAPRWPILHSQYLLHDGELQFADSRKRPVDLLRSLPGLFGNLNSKWWQSKRTVYCIQDSLKGNFLSNTLKRIHICVWWSLIVNRIGRKWVNMPQKHKKDALCVSATTTTTDSTE